MFLREFNHIILRNAVQVHISALHFTPQSTTIWTNFVDIPKQPALVKSGADTEWPSAHKSLSSAACDRHAVAFSPDGKLLAEIAEPRVTAGEVLVQIWDLNRCAMVNMIKWNLSGRIRRPQLLFSPDSETLLVSGSHSVHIWSFQNNHDADTHTTPTEANSTTVIISPDASIFALGSLDHDIEMWKVLPREKLTSSIGHGCPVGLSRGGGCLLYWCVLDSQSTRTLKCPPMQLI